MCTACGHQRTRDGAANEPPGIDQHAQALGLAGDSCATVACTPGLYCTRDANSDILHLVTAAFGRCVEPTGSVDMTEALQGDLAALPDPVANSMGVPYNLVPHATIRISDRAPFDGRALVISRRVILDGRGSVLQLDAPAGAPPSVAAVTLTPTMTGATEDALRTSAYSSIRNLAISESSTSSRPTIGIAVHVRSIRLENLRLARVDTGILATSHSSTPNVSVHAQQWSRLTFEANATAAIQLGANAYAGLLAGIELTGANGGISEASSYGNTYLAPFFDHTGSVSLQIRGSDNASTVVGVNLVTGAPAPDDQTAPKALFVGGPNVAALVGDGERVGGGASRLRFQLVNPTTGKFVRINVPGEGPAGSPLLSAFDMQASGTQKWSLTHNPTSSVWGFVRNDDVNARVYSWRAGTAGAEPAYMLSGISE